MNIKKIIGKIHLWVGLVVGSVVIIISITGCIYAFQSEIQQALQSYRNVPEEDGVMLTPSQLRVYAEEALPEKPIHAVYYQGRSKAVSVIFYSIEPAFYTIVYLNPYTGDVLKVKDMSKDFFYIVLQGHYYLWLPPHIGQPIVATATLLFVVLLVTGIVLWWPKSNARKQRFKVKWNGSWRRKNYDLHAVFGFYAMILALIISITGLIWGFQWMGNIVYRSFGGEKTELYADPIVEKKPRRIESIEDQVWFLLIEKYKQWASIEIHFQESDTTAIGVSVNPSTDTYWKSEYEFYNPYTLEQLPVNQVFASFADATLADKVIRMNYDIHTGAIAGLPGKIIAFSVSLICASLPITGFLLWLGRSRKKKIKSSTT